MHDRDDEASRDRGASSHSLFDPKGVTVLSARAARRPADDLLITQEGYDRLRSELLTLTITARRELAERLRHARADGGNPAENGDLMDALEESKSLERRIAELETRLAGARIAGPAGDDGVAAIGTRVGIRTREGEVRHYELVGDGEADPDHWRISISSPVGEAIAGRRAGETIDVDTPRRRVRFELVSVDPIEGGVSRAA
jgi:transcription elongation factor GreA